MRTSEDEDEDEDEEEEEEEELLIARSLPLLPICYRLTLDVCMFNSVLGPRGARGPRWLAIAPRGPQGPGGLRILGPFECQGD